MVYIHAGALYSSVNLLIINRMYLHSTLFRCCMCVWRVLSPETQDLSGMPVSSWSLCIFLSMCRWAGRTERERPAHGWSFTLPIQLLQHNVNQQDLQGQARPPSISLVHAPHQKQKISQRALGVIYGPQQGHRDMHFMSCKHCRSSRQSSWGRHPNQEQFTDLYQPPGKTDTQRGETLISRSLNISHPLSVS